MPPAYLRAPSVADTPRLSGCTGKSALASRADAVKAQRKFGIREVYQCRHCGLWHLSNQGKMGQ